MAPDSGLQQRVAQLEEELATMAAQARCWGERAMILAAAREGGESGPGGHRASSYRHALAVQAEAAAIGAEQAAQVRRDGPEVGPQPPGRCRCRA